MLTRFLSSRGLVSLSVVLAGALVAALGVLYTTDPMTKRVSYCAIMPDAIGLYEGNHVTLRGIAIGSVDRIEPVPDGVRVDFDIEERFALHGNVTATTVSNTIVADRGLAVLGESEATAQWPRDTCITDTYTPKSITDALGAFSRLAQELGGDDAPGSSRLAASVEAFEASVSGTGPQLNALISKVGVLLRSPDAAIGHIGALLEATAAIAESMAQNWGEIETAVTLAKPGLDFINDLWGATVQMMQSMLIIFPWFNGIAREYGRPILGALDAAGPDLKLMAANVGTVHKIITMIPPITEAFERTVDPGTGQVVVTYAQPQVEIPAEVRTPLCAVAPDRCSTDESGRPTVDLIPLVLGMAGTR